jgi:hypothetical protein
MFVSDCYKVIDNKPNAKDEIRCIRKYKNLDLAMAFVAKANRNHQIKQERLKAKKQNRATVKHSVRVKKRGMISRLVDEMGLTDGRRENRIQAKVFRKDPLNYNTENIGKAITKRGKIL